MVEVATAHEQGKLLLPVAAGADPSAVPLLGRTQYFRWLTDREDVTARVDAALQALDTGGAPGIPDGRSPYPGLDPFDRDMAWAFFGRGAEVRMLANRMRSPKIGADGEFVVVGGPSGCGKSSLVRAGLVRGKLEGVPADSYRLYWRVDGGEPTEMPISRTDSTVHEYPLSIAGWNWRPSGNYVVAIDAKDLAGREVSSPVSGTIIR
jgi:hypothetical protein